MDLVKVALAQVKAPVGAVQDNARRVLALARRMADDGVNLGCFPEQVLGGYPAEDLVQWRGFLDAQRRELVRFAAATKRLPTAFVLGLVAGAHGGIWNVAAVVHRGAILGLVPKEKLPTYDVFYEARTLARGGPGLELDAGGLRLGDAIFRLDFGVLAVEVCEDAWSPDGPMRRRCFSGAEIVVNVSASPYRVGVQATRREMLATRSADNQATLAWVNLLGAQDALVFDGGGLVFQNGRLEVEAPRFEEGLTTCVVDLDRTRRMRAENTTWRTDAEAFRRASPPVPVVASSGSTGDRSAHVPPVPRSGSFFLPGTDRSPLSPRQEMLDELFEALALGLADYAQRAKVFRRIGVALSGGRDSLLSLLVAWRACKLLEPSDSGAPELHAFYMPSRFSQPDTRAAAERAAADLRVPLVVVPIDEAFDREVEAVRQMLGGKDPSPITLQNVQARVRGQRMWNWANSADGLFVQTGDMSEKAVGYTTIGGDLEGAYSVIANVPKTVVVALLERLHERHGFGTIAACLATAPGPELAAGQQAEDELMPFPILDACLWLHAAEKMSGAEVARALVPLFPDVEPARLRHHAERFAELFARSIYKWVQAPLATHVGSLDLDRERALQLPVVQDGQWRERPED